MWIPSKYSANLAELFFFFDQENFLNSVMILIENWKVWSFQRAGKVFLSNDNDRMC